MAITQLADVNWDQAAYNLAVDQPLRAVLLFDQLATVKPNRQSMPGSSVIFNIKNDIAANTTPLTENTDVTPTTMGDTQATVTLNEYGDAVGRTRKLKGFSYVPVDPLMVDTIAFAGANSLNLLARVPFEGGTNVLYGGAATSRVTVAATHIMTSARIREATARLRTNKAMPIDGFNFAGIIHPHVAKDLREETGSAAWRDPNVYGQTQDRIWNAYVGTYEGVVWMENTEARILVDAGVGGTVDVYQTYVFGREAVAKAFSSTASQDVPSTEVSPVVDKLNRFNHVGWYWLGGYAAYRQAAFYRIETSSSLGVNT